MSYKFDPFARSYWDAETGRFLSNSEMISARERVIENAASILAELTVAAVIGSITIEQWRGEFRSVLVSAIETQFMFGRGGEAQMSAGDWDIISSRINRQDVFIARFAEDIAEGRVSEAQAADRASMFAESTRSAFEQGRSRSWTDAPLPAYPGDGGTDCLVRCRCRWDFRLVDGQVQATWKLNPSSEHCGGCSRNAMLYNPYIANAN